MITEKLVIHLDFNNASKEQANDFVALFASRLRDLQVKTLADFNSSRFAIEANQALDTNALRKDVEASMNCAQHSVQQGSYAEMGNAERARITKENDEKLDKLLKEVNTEAQHVTNAKSEAQVQFSALQSALIQIAVDANEAQAKYEEEQGETSGGNVNYYTVAVEFPKRLAPYTAECEDIIEALGMNFAEGEAFKSIWRSCAERTLGKKKAGNDSIRDAEKVVHYGNRMLAQRKRAS